MNANESASSTKESTAGSTIQLVDVTLRDGGYRNTFSFTQSQVNRITQSLGQAGIDYIEIGYRNGSFEPVAGIGLTGLTPDCMIRATRQAAPDARLCVMVHPKNVQLAELHVLRSLGVSMLRVCFPRNEEAQGLACIREAAQLGFVTTTNFTRITHMEEARFLALVDAVQRAGTQVVYVADSNGALHPQGVRRLFTMLRERVSVATGFHAHNNLDMALANTLAALEQGATFIDASLRGMGKGPGNLKLESIVAYLERASGSRESRFDFPLILRTAEFLTESEKTSAPELALEDVAFGYSDLSVDVKKLIAHRACDRADFITLACQLKGLHIHTVGDLARALGGE